jgi:hypothetical protein
LIIQDQYVQFTNIIKESVALNPSLACTEAEWQTAVTMSTNGVCEKFVIDDEAGTIRLPKYPDYLDLSINTGDKTQTVSVAGNGMTLGLMGQNGATYGLTNSGAQQVSVNIVGKYYGTASGTATDTWGQALPSATLGVTTDASKSGITGTVTIPAVQSEKIKGIYFIQVATGAETEDNIINEIELNNPFSLLDYKYSEYELNNISWLRSEGQYNSKAVYPAVYDLLLKIYNGIETKAGVSVKLNTEGYTNYDFVLNTAEETFRLPIKVKQTFLNAINGNMPVVGNGMTLGLTDGTEYAGLSSNSSQVGYMAPAQYGVPVGTAQQTASFSTYKSVGVTTDPTKSGLVAQVSQSAVSGLYLYFYVGETVQNANLINAGRIEEKVADIRAELPHKLNDRQITNCLLEVPQRIKLELNNGTITLKAGSVVIVPNGFEADGKTPKFDYVTVESDKRYDTTYGRPLFLFYNGIQHDTLDPVNCSSGSNVTTKAYSVYYDTDANLCKLYADNATTLARTTSFPICIANSSANGFTSIDQVFNGMGYIGSTVWVDKGVKGLIPNGRNEDGTLRNIEVVTPEISINYANNATKYCGINAIGDPYFADITYYYNEKENTNIQNNLFWAVCVIADIDVTNGNITSFNPKQPFRAIDASSTPHIIETYVNGTSWYRVWSDGWCEQGGRVTATGATVNFLKPFKDTNYTALVTAGYSNAATVFNWAITSKTTTTMIVNSADNTGVTTRPCDWQASGYIA